MLDPESNFKNGDIMLVGSPDEIPLTNLMGRVEVYGRFAFGTACGPLFNNVAATVVCQQLGHADGS